MEWKYTREIASEVVNRLLDQGYDAELLVEESKDISLSERVRRVNDYCEIMGRENIVLVSIHVNAAGNGGWHNARGWSVWVAKNAGAGSKKLAQTFYEEAERMGLKGNRAVPPEKYWTANFTILAKTKCRAVLTENMFQDNREDVDYLLSVKGWEEITRLHTKVLEDFCENEEGNI